MANTRELRRRIKSIKNTAQITKAMQMVAATKMRRAQNQAISGRPYSFNLNNALSRLLPLVDIGSHPLLLGNESLKKGIVLLSTDKGLCGALNTNLFRLMLSSNLTGGNTIFYTVGKRGRSFVVKSGGQLLADFENLDIITFRQAAQLARMAIDSFMAKEVSEVFIVYPRFVSTLRQEAVKIKLLPIDLESVIAGIEKEIDTSPAAPRNDKAGEFLFEPNPKILLDYILVHQIQTKIYQALLETKASEFSSRMIAMQNATDNALELVDDLNLAYNQTRQDSITKELLEITTAAAAMT